MARSSAGWSRSRPVSNATCRRWRRLIAGTAIAACWADKRKVPQVAFKPDFNRHKNAAPFKRNDVLLETMPIGVVVFPGSGISDNLADKARKLGIPLFDFRPKAGAR